MVSIMFAQIYSTTFTKMVYTCHLDEFHCTIDSTKASISKRDNIAVTDNSSCMTVLVKKNSMTLIHDILYSYEMI